MTRFFARVSARVGQAYTKLFPNTLKKRTWWPVFGVGVLLIAAMSVGIVHGQAVVIESLLNGLVDMIARILIELSKLCIFLTIFFLRAFITLASYNNFIDVSVVKLGWVMVRDVANMFFIVGLLVIAFATILGFESYEWKHGLVKIVLMAILINFSNLIAQLVIDVAHIFTITFLNAVSATAGGNLITLFQMDKILELAQSSPNELGATRDVASLTLFAGAVLAFIFALLAALTIGAYMVVMIFRIVVLWALIVLSPLAFMLYAVPKGEQYAHEWWSEFSKHVIVAPIMVFFLWLAFATLGTGQIISEIQSDPNVIQLNSSGETQSVTVLEISTWENFASFLLGIGFLWVGIKKTEETGATGAGLVGGAIDFTKNVATIATGYAAGRWLVGGAVDKVKSDFPIIGGKSLARKGEKIAGMYKTLKTKSGQRRDERIQNMEKKQEEAKGVTGKVGWWAAKTLYGSIFESNKRKDARAENWSEIAEAADREHEAKISTSRSMGGEIKLTARVKADVAEKAKSAKGPQKMAEEWLRLQEKGDKSFAESMDAMAGAKAKSHDLEELIHTEEKQAIAKKTDKLESGLDKGSHDFHEVRERLATLKPITEQIEQKVAADHHGHEEERLEQLLTPISPLEIAEYNAATPERKEEMEKDFKEREEYQKYNELATTAEKKLENVKGSNKAQSDLSAAETEAQLALAAALSKSPSKYAEREGVIAESQTRMKDIQDRRNADKEILLLSEIRKLLASGGSIQTLKTQAVLENQKEQAEIQKISRLGEERAAYYDDPNLGNDKARAMAIRQQTAGQILKKEGELYSNLSFNERRALEEQLIQEVAEAKVRGASDDDVRTLQRRQLALANINISSDAETSIAARQRAALASGFNHIDDDNRLMVELSRLTGVQSGNLGDLTTAFENMFDGNIEQRNQMMRTLVASYKSAASKGDEGGVGLIDEIVKDGKVEYVWQTDPLKIKEAMTYFAATSKMEGGVEGYAKQTYDAGTGSWQIDGFDDRGGASFTQAMTGKDARAFAGPNMQRLHEQMKRATVNQSNLESYINTLTEAKDKMGNGGFDASKRVWGDLYGKIEKEVRARGSAYLTSLYDNLVK